MGRNDQTIVLYTYVRMHVHELLNAPHQSIISQSTSVRVRIANKGHIVTIIRFEIRRNDNNITL
jgi:hypothetical protein